MTEPVVLSSGDYKEMLTGLVYDDTGAYMAPHTYLNLPDSITLVLKTCPVAPDGIMADCRKWLIEATNLLISI